MIVKPPTVDEVTGDAAAIYEVDLASDGRVFSHTAALAMNPDAYAAFEEASGDGGDLLETGRRFQREILSVGGSRPALDSFKAFRGREPSIDALLRHSGMSVDGATAGAHA